MLRTVPYTRQKRGKVEEEAAGPLLRFPIKEKSLVRWSRGELQAPRECGQTSGATLKCYLRSLSCQCSYRPGYARMSKAKEAEGK